MNEKVIQLAPQFVKSTAAGITKLRDSYIVGQTVPIWDVVAAAITTKNVDTLAKWHKLFHHVRIYPQLSEPITIKMWDANAQWIENSLTDLMRLTEMAAHRHGQTPVRTLYRCASVLDEIAILLERHIEVHEGWINETSSGR